jgi:microcystin-dependent protein
MQPFVGQIIPVGFNFAPVGWFLCQGQLVSIADYEVLYTLIGTNYGGNGTTTFGIPDLRGRSPLHQGQGPGLSRYVMGQAGGTESVTLLSTQMGSHTHNFMASAKTGGSDTPGSTMALNNATASPGVSVYHTGTPNVRLAPNAIGSIGGNQPHENRQPFQTVNYIIAWAGIFPSRN